MYPIDYPTITIAGRTWTVRYSMAAQIILVRNGVDPMELSKHLAVGNPRRIEYLVRLFAACVAENFIDEGRPNDCNLDAAWSADYWMTRISLLEMPDVDRVLGAAMGKAQEALKKRETTPPIPIAS